MEHFEARFSQVEVLPMVMHFMNELDLTNLFEKYIPTEAGSLANHAESLCILTANIICENKPLYKVQEWLSKFSDGFVDEPSSSNLFNDDRLARSLSALFDADRHSLMKGPHSIVKQRRLPTKPRQIDRRGLFLFHVSQCDGRFPVA